MREVLAEIGLVEYKRHARAKHIKILLRPGQSVRVTLPTYATTQDARQFVWSKRDWILAKQKELQIKVKPPQQFKLDRTYTFKKLTLHIRSAPETKAYLQYAERKMTLDIADELDLSIESTQAWITKQLEDFLRELAVRTLPKRVHFLAQQHHIAIQKVSVRRAKTRWGSCSSNNNINLSCYVYLLPDHLIDYVIHHELAHVKEKNHSARYWTHLEQLLPGASAMHQEMKKHRLGFLIDS